jgi:hypothetical protein
MVDIERCGIRGRRISRFCLTNSLSLISRKASGQRGQVSDGERHWLLQICSRRRWSCSTRSTAWKNEAKKLKTKDSNDCDLDALSQNEFWQLSNGEVVKVCTLNTIEQRT